MTDGDADGCFDGVGTDRVWLDLDGDDKFDPLTEQFPLGNAITVGTTTILVRPQPDGLGAQVRERPNETGTLNVVVTRLPRSEILELTANYVSEFGELFTVKSVDKPLALPVGKYRTDSVQLVLSDADGKVWRYAFYTSSRTFGIEIVKGKPTEHRLFDKPRVTVSFDSDAKLAVGESITVQPDVRVGELYMTKCESGSKFSDYGREVSAEVRLTEPGSVVLDRFESGFS